MILRTICKSVEVSPVPARSIADLELEEKVYKPDFEISEKFQGFSKELVRISLLGLGVYGFLIKMATEEKGGTFRFMRSLQEHKWLAIAGVLAFAICAACALLNGFLSSKCLAYQLNISRHLGRLEGDRWDAADKELSRDYIRSQQREQKSALKLGGRLLLVATLSLAAGAVSVAFCSTLVLLDQ